MVFFLFSFIIINLQPTVRKTETVSYHLHAAHVLLVVTSFSRFQQYIVCKEYKMSDDHNEYHIETADAGASATIPCEAGQIKKGG